MGLYTRLGRVTLTVVHVIAGTFVLAVAPAAILVRKGGRWHRRWGRSFMAAMSLVLLSAGFMWQPKGHAFLLALALISAYFVFSGYRIVIRNRRRRADPLDDGVDLAAAGVPVISGAWLLLIAATANGGLMQSLAPIMAALGVIAAVFAVNDIRGIVGPRTRGGQIIAHLSAMIAAYTSAVTAFVVINVHHVAMSFRWIVPIAVGTIIICVYSVPYRLPKITSDLNVFLARAKRTLRLSDSNTGL